MRVKKLRYVEVSYKTPDDELTQFRASIFETETPKKATEDAIHELMLAHPNATEAAEFMQRIVTVERAREIRQQFADGTWEGWPLGKESSNA